MFPLTWLWALLLGKLGGLKNAWIKQWQLEVQSVVIWPNKEIITWPMMLSTPCQKSDWVFINQVKPLTFSWLLLLTGRGNVDSCCVNTERSWMRPTKTEASNCACHSERCHSHTQNIFLLWEAYVLTEHWELEISNIKNDANTLLNYHKSPCGSCTLLHVFLSNIIALCDEMFFLNTVTKLSQWIELKSNFVNWFTEKIWFKRMIHSWMGHQ